MREKEKNKKKEIKKIFQAKKSQKPGLPLSIKRRGFTLLDYLSLENLKEPLSHYLIIYIDIKHLKVKETVSIISGLYPRSHGAAVVTDLCRIEKPVPLRWFPLDKWAFLEKRLSPFYLLLSPLPRSNISELMIVMDRLRGDDGCPWDRQQTHLSLRPYLIEEAYEVISAIENEDSDSLKEELGDLLLQVIFHASLGQEEGAFNFSAVVHEVIQKLIRRHPHVFNSRKDVSVREVKKKWEEIKKDEKKRRSKEYKGILQVDPFLPALMRAYKIQVKASGTGFDWSSCHGPLEKLQEEINELYKACKESSKREVEEEIGDLLFSVVNLCRFVGVNPEIALAGAIGKFTGRFAYIEAKAAANKKDISSYTLDELDKWWDEAKAEEKNERIINQ